MMIRATLVFAVAISVLSICLPFGSAKNLVQIEFTGKLHRELNPEVSGFAVRHLTPANEATLKKLNVSLKSPDRALAGNILHPKTKEDITVVLLESATALTLCADVNQDGTLPASECLPLTKPKNLTGPNVYAGEVRFELPVSMKYFQSFPVVVRLFNSEKDPEIKKGNRTVLYSFGVYVKGTANIAGRETLVKYSFDLKTGLIDPLNGQLGFDVNGDGQIDMGNFSSEWTGATNETVVFRVGQHYVSTKSVNTETGEISLRSHDAKDYKRIEVYVGAEIPDFSFQDFDGAPRKLSDFKGKYVLLDFWGSWCTPCKVEMPYLKAAYARFKSRGFEILGMDKDEDPAKAKLFVNENQMDWPQATTESIIDLIRFRFRISGWPSKILIDPQQRVVMVDAKGQLNGDKLADALDKLLPRN
jgi:thiol-disulfide isomerase/thioredoxin